MSGKGGILAELARKVEINRQKAVDSPILRTRWRKISLNPPGTPKQNKLSALAGILESRKISRSNLFRTSSDSGPLFSAPDDQLVLEDILKAIRENKNKKVKNALKERRIDLNTLNFRGVGPLHEACYYGNLKCVKALVNNGANVHFADSEGWTPLFAAVCGGHMACVKFLVENGVSVSCSDIFGMSPLRVAVTVGSLEIVEYLVKRGGDIMAVADDGKSPFQIAIELGDDKILAFFLHNPSFHVT